jgi:protein-S-isoprenylcysteine O-methyltransferase Ste14
MKPTFRQRGGGWVIAQFALMAAVMVLGVVFSGDWTRLAVIGVGAALFVAGGVFGIAGVRALGGNRTAFPAPREGSVLVRDGIYSRVRHPLYTSVMLASLGWALIWQSGPAFVAALLLLPFFRAKAGREERWLREKHPGYADYAKRVPGFVPRL